jgi:ribosome-associated toxin RatA of RatAB toxin-antitoxin module
MWAELSVGFSPFVEKYTSEITYISPSTVKITSKETNLLEHLYTEWNFSPVSDNYDLLFLSLCY